MALLYPVKVFSSTDDGPFVSLKPLHLISDLGLASGDGVPCGRENFLGDPISKVSADQRLDGSFKDFR